MCTCLSLSLCSMGVGDSINATAWYDSIRHQWDKTTSQPSTDYSVKPRNALTLLGYKPELTFHIPEPSSFSQLDFPLPSP